MRKNEERLIILERLFPAKDRALYRIGKQTSLKWFDQFEPKFERDQYAYFADEERKEAKEKIINELPESSFIDSINSLFNELGKGIEIDQFIGENYYFDPYIGLKLDNKQDKVKEDVRNVLKETKGRIYPFLKAIINLYEKGRWDRAFRGAAYADILAEIRELGENYPAPRDLVVLKSYKLYYKTGSRRYPTHTIPEEIIPVVKDTLKECRI